VESLNNDRESREPAENADYDRGYVDGYHEAAEDWLRTGRWDIKTTNPAIAQTVPHSFDEIKTWLEQEQAKQGVTELETEQDHKGPSEKIPTSSDSQKPLDPNDEEGKYALYVEGISERASESPRPYIHGHVFQPFQGGLTCDICGNTENVHSRKRPTFADSNS
jgi:hypothetical protein